MNYRPIAAPFAALCALLAGCNTRTNVSLTGNTPAQFRDYIGTEIDKWARVINAAVLAVGK